MIPILYITVPSLTYVVTTLLPFSGVIRPLSSLTHTHSSCLIPCSLSGTVVSLRYHLFTSLTKNTKIYRAPRVPFPPLPNLARSATLTSNPLRLCSLKTSTERGKDGNATRNSIYDVKMVFLTDTYSPRPSDIDTVVPQRT